MINSRFNSNFCKVAIIGASYMAKEHIRAFQDLHDVQIVAIQSRTRHRAEHLAKEFSIDTVCDSISEVYEKTRPDLVVVAVSIISTKEVCLECFKYPWVVLIEKPAGINLLEALKIIEVAKLNNSRAYVALNRRHYSITRSVVSDIKKLSGSRMVRVQDQQNLSFVRQLGYPQQIIDTWHHACSIHLIDYFFLLCRGKVSSVEKIIRWDSVNPRHVLSKINFDSGDIGIYEAIWDGPGPWAISLSTSQKRWEMRPLERGAYQIAGERALVDTHIDSIDIKFKAGLRRQAELAVLSTISPQPELPSLADAFQTMQLTEMIYS
jgi:predicted dehydrogenase